MNNYGNGDNQKIILWDATRVNLQTLKSKKSTFFQKKTRIHKSGEEKLTKQQLKI